MLARPWEPTCLRGLRRSPPAARDGAEAEDLRRPASSSDHDVAYTRVPGGVAHHPRDSQWPRGVPITGVGAMLRTMPHYLTCSRCGNLTPSLHLAQIDTTVPGAYVIVCKWCESGEPRPSQEEIMREDDEFWRDMPTDDDGP